MDRRPLYEHLMTLWFIAHVSMLLIIGVGRLEPATFGSFAHTFNNNVLRPVDRNIHRNYGALLGPRQFWGMFGSVGRRSQEMRIEIDDRDGNTRAVYVQRSDDATWNRIAFDQYRWREWLNQLNRMNSKHPRFGRFVRWVGARVAEDYPDACMVHVHVWQGWAKSPEQLRAGERRDFPEHKSHILYKVKGREGCP